MKQGVARSGCLLVLLAIAALACKKGKTNGTTSSTTPSVVDAGASPASEFEKKLEPTLAAIEKAGSSLPPRMTRGTLKLEPGKVIGDNAEYIHAEDMRDLTYPPTQFQKFRVAGSGLFLACARMTRKKDASVQDARKKLELCAKAEQLVVIRTGKFDEPKSHNGLSFVAGKVDGDVLIYSLPTMKLLGGYPFAAQSSKVAKEHAIDEDMQRNWAAAMKDGLLKLHPQSKLAFVF